MAVREEPVGDAFGEGVAEGARMARLYPPRKRMSRIGANSKVVLTHDVAQRDNLRVGRHDGVVAVVERLKGHPLFAHVTLNRSERSPIAALVTDLLESVTL